MAARRSGIAERRIAARTDGGADYAARRREIIRVATETFRAKGYAGTTLNDVAAILGADRATLYYYVASKEALFQECIHEAISQNTRDAIAIGAKQISPREKLHELIAMLIRSQEQYYPTMFVYIQEDMGRLASRDAEWATRMIDATRDFEKFFIDTLRAGVADGSLRDGLSPTVVANAIFGMTLWTHRWWVPGAKYSADQVIETFTTILFEGIFEGDVRYD